MQINPHLKDYEDACLTELVYKLCRCWELYSNEDRSISPWAQYHMKVSMDTLPQKVSTVAFNPILMAPPNDPSTVYTTLIRLKEAASSLGHSHIPICFDMGLLTKALEIVWANTVEFSEVVLLEGGMHFLMSVFSGIGFLYGDAGIKELLQDSGVFAGGTTQQILAGRDVDRAMYAFRLTDEVLNYRFVMQFRRWCEEKGVLLPSQLHDVLANMAFSFSSTEAEDPSSLLNLTKESINMHLVPLLQKFINEGQHSSPTFRFWYDFLSKVMLPFKTFLAATRKSQWSVYQASKRELLPLLFASNRTNYSRYMPVLMLMMERLPPDVQAAFEQGLFVAKLTDAHFNAVWLDYTLEATENKALKGKGGIIGLTLKGPALTRWFLARPVTAEYSTNFKETLDQNQTSPASKVQMNISPAAIRRWNRDVKKMKDMFEGTFVGPFNLVEPPNYLINFATGCVASQEVEDSLTGALDKGSLMASQFVSERLIPHKDGDRPSKSFYDSLPRSNVKTMADMKKAVRVHAKNVTLSGEVMYLRLLAVNALKKVPLQRVFSFENSPVPLSLFSEDGAPLSGVKSQFMHKLEDLLPGDKLTSVKGSEAMIFDGHAIIQMLPGPSLKEKVTFKDMAVNFLDYILHSSAQHGTIHQIHVVFDRYDADSIKNQTREKRAAGRQVHEYHVQLDVQVPTTWNLFLSRGENKSNLARCYTDYIKDNAGTLLQENQAIFISCGPEDRSFKVDNHQSVQFFPLASRQEEADSRIVLHSVVAARLGAKQIIAKSPDTDVLVLLLHHRPSIRARKIFFQTGHVGKHASLTRYIPVHLLYEKLTRVQHDVLLPVYCLSGCDTVSSFHGHGKATAFRIMMQKSTDLSALAGLGTKNKITKQERVACTLFVGYMYGKAGCDSLDKLRCEKASKKVLPKKLPPTENSLQQHILRAVYQLMIWRQANSVELDLPDPTQYGYYHNEANTLCSKMMDQAPELLNDLVCDCTLSSCNANCTCLLHDQPCTAACSCEAQLPAEGDDECCTNPITLAASTVIMDSDSDDEE